MLSIPGFVDLQVNGYRGVNFSSADLTEESFARACRQVLASGTAAFLPTVITSPIEVYERNLPMLAKVIESGEFRGSLLGLHLEGPFISPAPGAVGVHNPQWVRPPDVAFFDRLLDLSRGRIRMLTIAADQPGADDLARHAAGCGVVVSLGHHLATPDDLLRLADAGATALTHVGNGVPEMLPRLSNPIWSALAADGLAGMFIADGHHLPPEFLKTAIRAKGVGKTIIVSDASPAAGMPPGRYLMFGTEVVLEPDGLLHDPVKGCKAGSSAMMLHCMNHLASLGLLSPEELLRVGFHNALELIGASPRDIPSEPRVHFDRDKQAFV